MLTVDDWTLCGGLARRFSKRGGSDFIHVESTFVQKPNMSHQELRHACQCVRQKLQISLRADGKSHVRPARRLLR